jgi:hypothetical protein
MWIVDSEDVSGSCGGLFELVIPMFTPRSEETHGNLRIIPVEMKIILYSRYVGAAVGLRIILPVE